MFSQLKMEATQQLKRILLVDDDLIVLELVALFLAAEGIDVERAHGGREALDILKTSAMPDIVLVDHQMPEVSGTEIARHIRTLPEPRPRVIAMSASPLPPEELATFDAFLLKPVDRERLHAVLAASEPGQASKPGESERVADDDENGPTLDPSTVGKLRAIMAPDALQELYRAYVVDTRQRISELEHHAESGDEEALRRCAHTLKGAAAMAGVSGVAALAAGLEAGYVPRRAHGRVFQQLRVACDDVEQSMTKNNAFREAR